MIRIYNGYANRTVIRTLKKLCNINAEDSQNMFEILNTKGKVDVCENPDFYGGADELSTIVTIKTVEEAKAYLKKHLQFRIDHYLNNNKFKEDYLISGLVTFIKENGKFPCKDEMQQLEKKAEAKRISELPPQSLNLKKEIEITDIAIEALELAEEIMEASREENPNNIRTRPEPNPEYLAIENNDFKGYILHKGLTEIAKNIGFEFESEIDYKKFQS